MDKIDLFGSQILFRFNGQPTHNTKFGSIITLSILGILGLRLFFIIKDVFLRTSPQVIFQERQVDNPSLFEITNESFQFAFGMQDANFEHYIDESIYQIRVTQRTKKSVLNPTTNQNEDQWVDRDVKLTKCSLDNFPDTDTKEKFAALQYQNLYCFPRNETLHLEGDFGSPTYQFLRLTVTQCQNSTDTVCKGPDVLKKFLRSVNFAMYFSDMYVDPTEKNFPFQKFYRDMFYTTSLVVPKDVDFFLRNSYVQSDFGWVTSDLVTLHHPQFSKSDVSVSIFIQENQFDNVFRDIFKNYNLMEFYLKLDVTFHFQFLFNQKKIQPSDFQEYFLQMIIRFEKQKENLYLRYYKNLNSIISEIGGFTQSLLAIGFLICSRFSQLDLNKNIINEAFNFKNIPLNSFYNPTRKRSSQSSQDMNNECKKEDDKNQKYLDRNLNNNSNIINVLPIQSPSYSYINQNQFLQSSAVDLFPSTGRGNLNNTQTLLNEMYQQQQSQLSPSRSNKRNQSQNNQQSTQSKRQQKGRITLNDTTLSVNANSSSIYANEQQFLANLIQQTSTKDTQKPNSNFNQDGQLGLLSADHEKVKKQQQKLEEKEQKIKESVFKKLMQKTTSHMSLGVFEYLKLLIWPFGKLKEKKKVLDYSIDTLYYHLDVIYVVKKLLEVDKLKQILLDKDQLKLFEYIPKPTIISNYGFTEKEEELQIEIDTQHQDKRTELQKAQQAFNAYQNIISKDQQNLLDDRIIDLIDPQLLVLFGSQGKKRNSPTMNQQIQMFNTVGNNQQQQNSQTQIQLEQIEPVKMADNLQSHLQNAITNQQQKNNQFFASQLNNSQQFKNSVLNSSNQNQQSPTTQQKKKLQIYTDNAHKRQQSISFQEPQDQQMSQETSSKDNNNNNNAVNISKVIQQSFPISLIENKNEIPSMQNQSHISMSEDQESQRQQHATENLDNPNESQDNQKRKANNFIMKNKTIKEYQEKQDQQSYEISKK